MSLIVDETDFANVLVRQSLEKVFKQTDAFGVNLNAGGEGSGGPLNWEIKLDIQSFSRKSITGSNRTVDYRKILQSAAKSARG